jgi:hypothetical protein
MKRSALLLLLLAAACGHEDPLGDGKPVQNGPGQPPNRLTFNVGTDQWVAWESDNSLWYSAQDSLEHDRDHCLVSIPAVGGTYTTRQCPPYPQNNLTEVLQQPTILDDKVAWAVADLGTFPPEHVQYRFAIYTATTARDATPRLIMRFPYIAPSGLNHDAPLYLRWVNPGMLAYIGAEAGCCNKDTLRFGEQIVLLDITGDTPVKTFVPDTYRASALGVSADRSSLYYTFYGDHRVYQRNIASGAVTVLHDFGVGHIVRDPDINGTQLVATIDGFPGFQDYPPFDSAAVDHGGFLITVNLATGAETPVNGGAVIYKRPRYSPSGDRFVAEGYPLTLTSIINPATGVVIRVDTTYSRSADLWTFEE